MTDLALPAPSRRLPLILLLCLVPLVALVVAVKLWGLVALTLTALACVPVMFAFFIAIARP